MPEIKNTFLAGKMNKSLDDRIVPKGEYRDALNVQVTKSEGSNVGVIHNIKGNKIAHTAVAPVGEGHETIGSFFDEKNDRIFWFVTNNTNNYIYLWNVGDSTASAIVSGTWLNFNKSNKITGVNILEDLFFWTDNRNQPRRINVPRAVSDNSYYDSDVKVSVARYAPYLPPQITSTTASDFYDADIRSERIKEEFVRFAYRYKFKDNEYSIISPFTPIVFRMDSNVINTTKRYNSDSAFRTSDLYELASKTTISNMVNKINKVPMTIPLPTNPTSDYEIEKIEILYKESDSNAVRIIESLDISDSDGTSKSYTYKSSNFKSTLPEDQITRVFDNIPIKAKAQEIVGNRVVYGNITTKQDLPAIDYSVSYSRRGEIYSASGEVSTESSANYILGNQSIKQRRTYEVGIVLSDIFGRTSPVILSDSSTITVEAKGKDFNNLDFDGDSLKVLFNSSIATDTLYNASTNVTGWYSYRIVVKQTEQEYYNVYTPGVWNYGRERSHFVIHADNVNKLPRESGAKDQDDLFANSTVRVYPKVVNISTGVGQTFERTYRNSSFDLLEVVDIANLKDYEFSQSAKIYEDLQNPLVGKVNVEMGTRYSSFRNDGDFAVFETEPFQSALDIYYETPTTGLISEINTGINEYDFNTNAPISFSLEFGSYAEAQNHPPHDGTRTFPLVKASESSFANTKIADLYIRDTDGKEIPGGFVELSLTSSQYDNTVSSRYKVEFDRNSSRWGIYLNEAFTYEYVFPAGFADIPDPHNFASRPILIDYKFVGDSTAESTTVVVIEENAAPICLGPISASFDGKTPENNGTYHPDTDEFTNDDEVFRVYGNNGTAKRGSTDAAEFAKSGLTFSFVSIKHKHVNEDGSGYTYTDLHPVTYVDTALENNPTITDYTRFTDSSTTLVPGANVVFDIETGTGDDAGIGIVTYPNAFSAQNLTDAPGDDDGGHEYGDEVIIKIKVSEVDVKIGENEGNQDIDETFDSEEFTVTLTSFDLGSAGDGVKDSDVEFSAQLYYSAPENFSNAYDACQSPVSGPEWSLARVFYAGDDPFVVEEGTAAPGRMYKTRELTTAANSGWYKRTDTRVIGYYFAENSPAGGAVWWYETPAYCDTLTQEDAENARSYSPPAENDLVFGEPEDENPYGLGPVPDENIP